MNITILQMDLMAETDAGRLILNTAIESKENVIITRKIDPRDDGPFIVMFMDWKGGQVLHLHLEDDEIAEFAKDMQKLASLTPLDGFDEKKERWKM